MANNTKKVESGGFEMRFVPLPAEKTAAYENGLRIFVELARRYKAKRMAEGTWAVEVKEDEDEQSIPSD